MATATHDNFYESLAEAHIRLLRSVVVYEGAPYKVLAVTNHKPDKIFRIYLWPTGIDRLTSRVAFPSVDDYNTTNPALGDYLDKYIETNKNTPLVRKYMSAAGFNKFRPFPLGMVNAGNYCFYVERRPVRRTEQGLTQGMLKETRLTCNPVAGARAELGSEGSQIRDCIMNVYPTPQEVLSNLNNPDCDNVSVGFNRSFGFVRGPLDTMYLAYKSDIVGLLPYNSLESVVLGKVFKHLKEVVTELNLFGHISQK